MNLLICTVEEFKINLNSGNKARGYIKIKDIVRNISLPKEIAIRDQKTDNINDNNFNIFVHLYPTEGRREGGPTYYCHSFGV